jgi:CheY-like chemotaxis protein
MPLVGRRSVRPHAVVAEDDEALRELFVEVLAYEGYDVSAAGDGRALIEELARCEADGIVPALIVCDVHMPRTTGLEAVAAMRARGWCTPVVFVTAARDAATLTSAALLAPCAVVHKPFGLAELRSAAQLLAPSAPPRVRS